MEQFLTICLVPVAVGVLNSIFGLVIEYWIVQPIRSRHTHLGRVPLSEGQVSAERKDGFSPYTPYLDVLIAATGAFWALLIVGYSILLLVDASGDMPGLLVVVGVVAAIAAVIGGGALALLVDKYYGMERARLWQRMPLAGILGVVGGFFGLLLLVGWFLWKVGGPVKGMDQET